MGFFFVDKTEINRSKIESQFEKFFLEIDPEFQTKTYDERKTFFYNENDAGNLEINRSKLDLFLRNIKENNCRAPDCVSPKGFAKGEFIMLLGISFREQNFYSRESEIPGNSKKQ